MASRPSEAKCKWMALLTSRNASRASRASPGLSSTKRTSMALSSFSMTFMFFSCRSRALGGDRRGVRLDQDAAVLAACRSSALLRQLDLRQPEIADACHEGLELVQLYWFGEVAIGLELIAVCDIRFRVGSSQDDRWNHLQIF